MTTQVARQAVRRASRRAVSADAPILAAKITSDWPLAAGMVIDGLAISKH